jgi:hypothetical protein
VISSGGSWLIIDQKAGSCKKPTCRALPQNYGDGPVAPVSRRGLSSLTVGEGDKRSFSIDGVLSALRTPYVGQVTRWTCPISRASPQLRRTVHGAARRGENSAYSLPSLKIIVAALKPDDGERSICPARRETAYFIPE